MCKIITVAAVAVCLLLVLYLLNLKRQMRMISAELEKTSRQSYNRLITVELFDKDLNGLAAAVNREIDSRKQMKLRLELTEKSMRQAISDIAHDLRTPLSVIKGELQIVAGNKETSEELQKYVDICIKKSDELKYMTDGFFELALLESDNEKAELKRINVTNLLMRFIAENEGVIRQHGLEPDIILPGSTVFAMGDEMFLMRILGNLLGNVIKYSSGSFTLELTQQGTIRMSNPAGSAKTIDTSRIFDRSYRESDSRKSGSAGLGLYIVRLLCDKISAEAKAETDDESLTITIKLLQAD